MNDTNLLSMIKKFKLQACFIFLISFLYSFCIGSFEVVPDHIVTIFYIIASSVYFIYCAFVMDDEKISYLSQVLVITFAVHFGLLLGYAVSGAGYELLWLDDAVLEHVPKSQEVAHFLRAISAPEEALPGYYRTSHFLTGVLFLIKESPLMSGVSMFIFKLLCTLGIYKLAVQLFDKKVAYISALLYTLSPSIIFYSLTFYKEAAVQFWYVCFLYIFYSIAFRKKYFLLAFAFLAMFLLAMERNYVAVSLVPSIVIFIVLDKDIRRWTKIIMLALVCVILFFIWKKYINFISWENLGKTFVDYRKVYNQYSGVDPRFNTDLPYILSWIKLYLTPIIAPAKFILFYNYSILLTWGSFVHQATMVFFSIGAYLNLRSNFKTSVFYLLPFFIFMCAFAYISSYSGRVRNSYYPVIVIFAAYGVVHYLVPKIKNTSLYKRLKLING